MAKETTPMEGVEVPEIVAPAPKAEEETQALAHVQDPELYLAMDKRDEFQIVTALAGRYIEEFVYEFRQKDGRIVTGLSWMGIQEASREYGGIQCKIIEERNDDLYVIVTVEAKDIKTGSVRIGRSKQSHRMKLKTGKFVTDEFSDIKAISKAQRNAVRQLLPQALLKQWIDRHRSGTKLETKPTADSPEPVEKQAEEQDEINDNPLDILLDKMGLSDNVAELSKLINESASVWGKLKGEDKVRFNMVRDKRMSELKAGQEEML